MADHSHKAAHKAAMATHPPGIVVEIAGTLMGDRGRSCKEHSVCGSVLEEDMVVCLRKVQILIEGQEETAIACYLTPTTSRVLLAFIEKYTGVWSILRMKRWSR